MAAKPSMTQAIIIQLLGWLVWLSGVALGQLEFSEAITGSVNITDIGITCLSNAAVFVTSLLRGRLYLEIGTRDVLATTTGPAKLEEINGEAAGLTTCKSVEKYKYASVVMLSNNKPSSSIRLFMKYMYNFYHVNSILLIYIPLKEALNNDKSLVVELCNCNCNCIVFHAVPEITEMKDRTQNPSMPLKQLRGNDSMYLLPSGPCVRQGCHGCPRSDSPPAVCDALDNEFTKKQAEPTCICIPVNPSINGDYWTYALMKSFKSKDQEDRGAMDMASVALENYLSGSEKEQTEEVFYDISSLIVPRIIEISINVVLTVWIKLDGFSSAIVARRVVKSHVVNSTGNGFAANAFLTGALVKSNPRNTNVCQVLRFRGCGTLKPLSLILGGVNLICSVIWALRIAFGGGSGKWYKISSMPASKPRIAVILAAICIGLVLDLLELMKIRKEQKGQMRKRRKLILGAVIIVEMAIVASGITVMEALGIKGIGTWVYSALQGLVWVKWSIGCYLLRDYSPQYVCRPSVKNIVNGELVYSSGRWVDNGTLVYSSAFLLNSVLAGVRGWK